MPFLGIISDSRSEKIIQKILIEKLGIDNNIIIINDSSIENLKNIKFETILMIDHTNIKDKELLKKILENTKYLVLNADRAMEIEIVQKKELNVITFGFNSKSTITASSVEENILLCVQRTINSIDNKKIEQQEVKINIFNNSGINVSILIGIASVMLLYNKIII